MKPSRKTWTTSVLTLLLVGCSGHQFAADDTVEVLEGTGALLTCADETVTLEVDAESTGFGLVDGGDLLPARVVLSREGGETIDLRLMIPKGLEDGVHEATMPIDAPAEPPDRRTLVSAVDGTVSSGTVEMRRTRSYPYVDVENPANGSHRSELELTLDLSGRISTTAGCGDFRIPPLKLRMVEIANIENCQMFDCVP